MNYTHTTTKTKISSPVKHVELLHTKKKKIIVDKLFYKMWLSTVFYLITKKVKNEYPKVIDQVFKIQRKISEIKNNFSNNKT